MATCMFCEPDNPLFVLKEYPHWILRLSRSQQVPGWCHASLKRHAEQFEEMTDEELSELKQVITEWKRALHMAFNPDWFNVMQLGNADKHLHFQLVPRYQGKRNFEGREFADKDYGKMIISVWKPEDEGFLKKLKDHIAQHLNR